MKVIKRNAATRGTQRYVYIAKLFDHLGLTRFSVLRLLALTACPLSLRGVPAGTTWQSPCEFGDDLAWAL